VVVEVIPCFRCGSVSGCPCGPVDVPCLYDDELGYHAVRQHHHARCDGGMGDCPGCLLCTWHSSAYHALDRAAYHALDRAADVLRHQGSLRFQAHGPHDVRGAALWDAGCHIDPDVGDALKAGRKREDAR